MYKIIGCDGKEYGPVSAEQIRAWLREGRATMQTLTQPMGGGDWRPLASLPEFATPPSVVPPVTSSTSIPGADKKLTAGILGILLGEFGIHKFVLGYTGEGIAMLLVTLLTCGIGWVVMKVIGVVEGITYLVKSDTDFVATYITGRKGWF